ncbi:MAG: type restriction enzyme subunit [Thermoanaerobaculia bacterium]|jgi:type I restriction enzyme S subunit|nr:type restriction enzyme subunit [Thermoanaerobaculia bacterium]
MNLKSSLRPVASEQDLPPHWRVVDMGELLVLSQYGLSVRGNRTGTYPILRMNCQDEGEVTFRDLQFVELDHNSFKTFRLFPGDILFNRTNSHDLVGRTAILREDRSAVFASYLIRLRVDTSIADPEYVAYYLNSSDSQSALKNLASRGVSQSNISASRLRGFRITLPSLAEQQTIASILSRLRDAIRVEQKRLAVLCELKSATVARVFREGVRGRGVKATAVGEIPNDWDVLELRHLLREPLRNGHSAPAVPSGSGIRTLTLTAVTKRDFSIRNTKITSADATRVANLWLQPGDIFIERANTFEMVGLAALYRGPSAFAIFPDLLIRVRIDDRMIPAVLAEWLLTPYVRAYFQRHCSGAATSMPKIDQGTIERTLIAVPPMEEQKAMCELFATVDSRIDVASKRLATLRESFAVLIRQLLSGQLRVTPLLENQPNAHA